MIEQLDSIDDVKHFTFKAKTNWFNLVVIFLLSTAIIFSALSYLSNVAQDDGVKLERQRLTVLNDQLYNEQQYQVLDYKIGTCEGSCSTATFTKQDVITSCAGNNHVQIQTVVKSPVSVTVKVSFRIVNLDKSFTYYDDKQLKQGPTAVETRLEPKTLYPNRPADWFCLPPGTYQEQATIEYDYQNEAGFRHKSLPVFSNIFTVK